MIKPILYIIIAIALAAAFAGLAVDSRDPRAAGAQGVGK